MAKEDLRGLSTDEMQSRLADSREELMNLRFQQATGELSDFTRMSHARRQIARILTILNERARKASTEGEA